MSTDEAIKAEWTEAVIRVGDGRGFVVAGNRERFVITAGHCLPTLPGCGQLYGEERTFSSLLGPIGGEPSVAVECLFADPVADLAILGSPDTQELPGEAKAYETLIEQHAVLTVGAPKVPEGSFEAMVHGWMLSLGGQWFDCEVHIIGHTPRCCWIENAAHQMTNGMSGSPVIDENGRAISVVCTSSSSTEPGAPSSRYDDYRSGGPNPLIARALPMWAFADLRVVPSVRQEAARARERRRR